MLGLIGAVISFFSGLIGLFKPKEPSALQTGQKLGNLSTDVEGLETENAQLKEAASARADADAASVRDDPNANHVTLDPSAPINTDPDGHFRD